MQFSAVHPGVQQYNFGPNASLRPAMMAMSPGMGAAQPPFMPSAVNSSPPRPPFAPVRGVPYDAGSELPSIAHEIQCVQQEISSLCDANGNVLAPHSEELFQRIGQLQERNASLQQHQTQLLYGANVQMHNDPHQLGGYQQVGGYLGANERDATIAELQMLLEQAENKASSMQNVECMLEAQLKTHEDRFLKLEEEALRMKREHAASAVATDDAIRTQVVNLQVELEEMNVRTQRREEDYRVLLQEKQQELDVIVGQMSERESFAIKREEDGEKEVTSLIVHAQELEESNRIFEKTNEEMQQRMLQQHAEGMQDRAKLIEQSEEIALLKNEIAAFNNQIATLTGHVNSVEDVRSERDRALEDRSNLAEVVKRHHEEISVLELELEKAHKAEEEVRALAEANNAKIEELQATCIAVETENRMLAEQEEKQRDSIQRLTEENEHVKEEYKKIEADRAMEQAHMMQLESDVIRLQEKEKDYMRLLAQRTVEAEGVEGQRVSSIVRSQTMRDRALSDRIQQQEDKPQMGRINSATCIEDLLHQRFMPEKVGVHNNTPSVANFLSLNVPDSTKVGTSAASSTSMQAQAGDSRTGDSVAMDTMHSGSATPNSRITGPSDTMRSGDASAGKGLAWLKQRENIPDVYIYAFDVIEKFGWGSLRAERTWTPLHWAAYENRADVCSWLIARGADPHQVDEHGKSALAYAIQRCNSDAVEVLSVGLPSFAV